MKKIITNALLFIVLVVTFSLSFSCSIGLGEAVDTRGPTVKITSPEARETVQTKFNISGTISDDFSINSVVVRIQKNGWESGDYFEWKNSKGEWQYKARGTSDYVTWTEGIWQQSNGSISANWAVNNIDFSSMPGGSYEIIVVGSDDAGNGSADSRKTRTIIVDDLPPSITITSPSVKDDKTVYGAVSDYRDITKISSFITGDFQVSGITKDDNAITYIDLYIKDEDSSHDYFVKRLVSDSKYSDGKDYILVDTLRSWEVNINLSECQLGALDSGKHVLKIITESCDVSKNSVISNHGFFCLWKEADIPWLVLNLGTQANPLSVYAGTSIMGNAYDDEAVSEVSVTIRENGPNGAVVSGFDNTNIFKANDGESENNVFFSFSVPENVKVYHVEVKEKDNKGNSAVPYTGYIEVVDKTFPSVQIKHFENNIEKQVGDTLFGNSSGDFELRFTAKDDTKVSSLKVVYITNPEDVVKYANRDAEEWNNTGIKTDLKNGKVVEFSNPQQTGSVNESGIDRKVYDMTLALNLFTDLGIDGNTRKLSNQTFVVRIQDEYNNAITKEYTILGDINAPTVEFTNIVYNGKTITDQNELLDAFVGDCSVTVNGKIGDDSFTVWGDTGKLKLELSANEKNLSYSLSTDGTFTATTTDREILKGASLSFKATATDWAGNSTIGNYSFVVDTSKPRVDYFYAKETDGCYGAGKVIDIRLRFNKPLKLTGESTPEITLNNNAVVSMDTSTTNFPNLYAEGEREYSFKYTIENDSKWETDKLSVAVNGFNLNGCSIADGKITQDMVNELTQPGSGTNLGDRKTIIINIDAPKVNNISFDESTGILTVTFSKKVKKNQGKIVIRQKVEENWHEKEHEGQSHTDTPIPYAIKVPPVLSESEYRILVAKQPKLKEFYESGTNGATGNADNYVADMTPKYILSYGKEITDSDVITTYLATENHILSVEIGSNKVEFVKDSDGKNTNEVKVKFGPNPLPCKGADYKVEIPAGIVIGDVKIGTGLASTVYSKEITASGIEAPVIRIKKTRATIGSDYKAIQPKQTDFKYDCETPNVTLTYKVQKYLRDSFTITSDTYPSKDACEKGYKGKTKNGNPVTNSLRIGDDDYNNGLEYEITVTASKGGSSAVGKEVAKRTVIEIQSMKDKVSALDSKNYNTWNTIECPGKTGLFIRGGSNISGPNSIEGYPTTWDNSDWNSENGAGACLMTLDSDKYYFVSWAINGDYYFRVLAGLMDQKTITDENGKGQGPKYGIFGQDNYIPGTNIHPVHGGGKVIVSSTCSFYIDDSNGIKAQKYRD